MIAFLESLGILMTAILPFLEALGISMAPALPFLEALIRDPQGISRNSS